MKFYKKKAKQGEMEINKQKHKANNNKTQKKNSIRLNINNHE